MTDLYLQAMMQGETLKKSISNVSNSDNKNRFDKELEKEIDAYIASLPEEETNSELNKLTSPAMKRARIKTELIEQAKLSELSEYIDSAFKILKNEAKNYLDKENLETLNQDFANGSEILEEIDLNFPQTENFKSLLQFSDSTIESIVQIGLAKYRESQFIQGLSLFILLATLIPENPNFWHRAGIFAHKCENYELATKFYSAAASLDPFLIAPWAFMVDCYLKREMKPEAKVANEEAMNLYKASHDESWKEFLLENELILKCS
jgi:tetratricopeptide (TPR) repeat protein